MSCTILLADDHDSNRAVLKRRLERKGYVVTEARDGADAVEQFRSCSCDLLLLDISMPVMDGLEVLKAIRMIEAGAETPAVALTAHSMPDMRERCQAAGFDAFVPKPIEFEDLLQVILSFQSRNVSAPQRARP